MSLGTLKEDDADLILKRMQAVRSAGHCHADELQGEMKRLVDWKEYVLAKPLFSVAAASVLGFALVRSTARSVSRSVPQSQPILSDVTPAVSLKSTIASGVLSLASTLASSAIKSYIASLSQRNKSEGGGI